MGLADRRSGLRRAPVHIGVLVPPGNRVHAREFERLRPDGVTFHFAEFDYPDPAAPAFCDALVAGMAAPAAALRQSGAEALLIGCTTASMVCAGADFQSKLEAVAGVPVVTAAEAICEAIGALGVATLAVATPYGQTNNGIVARFLAARGIGVSAIAGLDLDRSLAVWRARAPAVTSEQMFALGLDIDSADAAALFMPCTGIRSLDAIAPFEADRGKPAFSAVQAGYWSILRRIGFDGRQPGYGRLIGDWDF